MDIIHPHSAYKHVYLIFIEFAVFELSLSLILKCDDDKTDENIHHKEGDDDNKCDVEYRNGLPRIMHRSFTKLIAVD